jgi:1A family penicillin-binding protein
MSKHKNRFEGLPRWKKIGVVLIAAGLFFAGAGLLWAATIKLPDVSTFEARKIANSSKIVDRTGEVVLYDINQGVRRTEVPLEAMSDNIKNAVVAIEDAHFYTHNGIRPTSILRAVFINLTSGSFSQGGSTLTQQIIKNTLLNTDKTIVRKFKEWVLAIKLERYFTKEQILTIYLNDAPFGGTIYGVEEAAQAFFGIPASELSVAQSAYLAALMPAPSYYSPFGTNKDKLTQRKNLVLEKMEQYGYIDKDTKNAAVSEEVVFNPSASNSIKAPHFTFYVLDYLEKTYGKDVMESGGYTIVTTLDYKIQEKAEAAVTKYAEDNLKRYNASNSALVAIDPTTGQIISMVGSKDYFNKEIDGAFNIATANRQPGSSFKPFAYLTAFGKGYTPETILFDVPTEFSTSCPPITAPAENNSDEACYHPQNFDGKFKGPISMRSALAESRNIPSVKTLYLAGVDTVVKTAQELGITTLQNPKEIGLSLVLGGGEVKLLDMVSAYSVFANSGTRNPVSSILEIRDRNGKVIERYTPDTREVFDKQAILTLNDVLSDPVARTPTFGSSITIPGVAVKTGTTNDERDAWIIGYTPTLAVGVWSGNNNNRSMRSGGAAVSGPIWKEFMNSVLAETPAPAFEKPAIDPDYDTLKPILRGKWMGNRGVLVDSVTGSLATDTTPVESRIEKIITDVQDILYWVDKDNPRGPAPTNPAKDPQFRLWNPPVQAWWLANQSQYGITTPNDIPNEYDTLHSDDTKPDIEISGISNQLSPNSTSTITISDAGQYPLTSVDLFINNTFITTLSSPFRFRFTPTEYGYGVGTYTLKATGTNSLYLKGSTEKTFTLI